MLPDGCRVPKVLFFLEIDIVKCQFVCCANDKLQLLLFYMSSNSFNKSLTFRLNRTHL
jgi:hypothetical protein